MFKYQILVEYVGTNFKGWQVQKKGKTIQGLIQKKISKILNEKILLIGSGRTDTGVHAIEQSAHFECKNQIKDFDKFLKSTNYFLNSIYDFKNSEVLLQQQVRSMVGCLKYVGEKKWSLKKFMIVMNKRKRILCAPPAPPEGLYLARVIY